MGYRKRHTVTIIAMPLLCVIAILIIGIHIFLKRAEPVFVAQTSNYSNTAFTDLVNKSIINITGTDGFGSFFKPISSDTINGLETDTSKINASVSQLLIDVQNALNSDYPAKVYIPLGSLTDYYLLSSAGPSIPITVIPISVVESELMENFESVGINQVRHSIKLKIWVKMRYRGYLLDEKETITTTVPIAETLISGGVPQYYGDGVAYPAE